MTVRCPTCGSPVESAEPLDADGQTRLNPCNHYVTVDADNGGGAE